MDNLHNSMQENSSTLEANVSVTDTEMKAKHERLFQRGCQWVGIGVMILGISFGINFVLFHSNGAFIPVMYVMTTVGAICTMRGLMNIFGN